MISWSGEGEGFGKPDCDPYLRPWTYIKNKVNQSIKALVHLQVFREKIGIQRAQT